MIKNITIIGSGNVATQLGKALIEAGFIIDCIYSRTKKNAASLASHLNTKHTNDLGAIPPDSDLYIIAIPDDAIASAAKTLSPIVNKKSIVVHSSGSTALAVLDPLDCNTGIFYPLQTFSKNREADFKNIPILINSNNKEVENSLVGFANLLSSNVKITNDDQRLAVHVAAVFANNFSNFLITKAEEILNEKDLDFSILYPLILETAKKACEGLPSQMQTGPAKRNDLLTINKHLDYLEKDKKGQILYSLISQMIRDYHKDCK